MKKLSFKSKKTLIALALAACMVLSVIVGTVNISALANEDESTPSTSSGQFSEVYGLNSDSLFSENYNSDIVLSNSLDESSTYKAIISLDGKSLLDYATDMDLSVAEYVETFSGVRKVAKLEEDLNDFAETLTNRGLVDEVEYLYTSLDLGLSVVATGDDLNKIAEMDGVDGVVVSETYLVPETSDDVNNDTNVYKTGIYDTSDLGELRDELLGDGMLIAVLDTGMDVQHEAFQEENFEADRDSLKLGKDGVKEVFADTMASQLDSDASAETVYKSEKIPYAFDYADKDTNVYPSYSSHGVHVAGIIAGNYTVISEETMESDDELAFEYNSETGEYYFQGVVPNAQIAVMKVFTDDIESDGLGGAETTDILAALNDCVVLGVDVINMSLGSSAGFSSYADEYMEGIYSRIEEAGISLVCAASNDYSSGYGGNNGTNLTSNPDSATVGSPSTYQAAISVASINGQKDPYMLANGTTQVYYTEATDGNSNKMDFVQDLFDILKSQGKMDEDAESITLNYVVIPGLGRSYNYSDSIVQLMSESPTIALVQRGTTTFQEKMRIAKENGAVAIIIYNNVAGKISMTMGEKDYDDIIPSCSITMDIGDELVNGATGGIGKIELSLETDEDGNLNYSAGPFMSDFSSWGPTPSLKLKPEITAYGGNVTSSVAGGYDVYSGTSMATPNMAGATAIVRQYLKKNYPNLSSKEISAMAYQMMMSTADIVINEEGNPYSPRKQGAGIANIKAALYSQSYLYVTDSDGNVSPKTKIELGDDPEKNGVYTFLFYITNRSDEYAEYSFKDYIMTETVSSDGKTVAEKAYMLDDCDITYLVDGVRASDGIVSVSANSTVKIEVTIKLSQTAKQYLDSNFANGMYVEGFIALEQTIGDDPYDLSIPFLAFYGDWTSAPILDYSQYEVDENLADDSIADDDKYEVQFWATTPYSRYQEDYILPMGDYVYTLSDDSDPIYSSEEKAAISRYNTSSRKTSYQFYAVYAGLLRGMAVCNVEITNEMTGEVIWSETLTNVSKGYANGGSTRPGYIEVEFDPSDEKYDLPNNTKCRFTMVGYLDYGDGTQGNSNSFSFTFYTDYESPSLVDYDVRYDTYTDSEGEKQTRIYLDVTTYDNHYTQVILPCYVDDENTLNLMTEYAIPVYSDRIGQTVTTSFEITDLYKKYYDNFYIEIEDYAMNYRTYTLDLSSVITFPETIDFKSEEITVKVGEAVSPDVVVDDGETYDLLWRSADESIAKVKDGEIYGVSEGETYVYVYASNSSYLNSDSARIKVIVQGTASTTAQYEEIRFELITDSSGTPVDPTGTTVDVDPNEYIQLTATYEPWYLPEIEFVWSSSNESVATVDENGLVHTLKEGTCGITARMKDGVVSARVSLNVGPEFVISSYVLTEYHGSGGDVVVPSELNFMYIDEECFMGNTDITSIVIPDNVTEIREKAFYGCTNLTYVKFPKTLTLVEAQAFENCTSLEQIDMTDSLSVIFGDRCFFNDVSLSEIINDERLTAVWDYTFAGCSSLTTVNMSNLVQVGTNAFANCTSLSDVTFSKYSQIGENMFFGCISLKKVVIPGDVIGANAFYSSGLEEAVLSGNAVIGEGAFRSCLSLTKLFMVGNVYEIGSRAFEGCTGLTQLVFPNNSVSVATDAFYNCSKLRDIGIQQNTLLENIQMLRKNSNWSYIRYAEIELSQGAYSIRFISDNDFECANYTINDNVLYSKDGTEILLIPEKSASVTIAEGVKEIGNSLFYGRSELTSITLPSTLKRIGNYAFAYSGLQSVTIPASVESLGTGAFSYCISLESVVFEDGSALTTIPQGCFNTDKSLKSLILPSGITEIESYAFGASGITAIAAAGHTVTNGVFDGEGMVLETIGEGAFSLTEIEKIYLPDTLRTLDDYVFANGTSLRTVEFNSKVAMGDYVFFQCPYLQSVTFYDGMTSIGNYTFASSAGLTDLDEVILPDGLTAIGDYVFYCVTGLQSIKLPESVRTIGDYAFYMCTSLEEINLENIVSIGDYAFTSDTDYSVLESIDLSSCKSVGDYAFYQTHLSSLDAPVLETIGEGSFGYTRLKKIVIPETLENIRTAAFVYNFYLTEIEVEEGNDCYFVDTDSDGKGIALYSYIKDGYQVEAFAYGISQNSYTVLEGTVRIGERAFTGANNLDVVTLPVTLKTIGDKGFFDCGAVDYIFKSYNAPTLEARYIDGDLYYSDTDNEWFYTAYSYNQDGDDRYYANFLYYMLYQSYNSYDFGLTIEYPSNGIGYDEYIWSAYFSEFYISANETLDDTTLEAIELIKALPSVEEIAALSGANDLKTVEQYITLLRNARQAYKNVVTDAQLAFILGNRTDYDSVNYLEELTARELQMSAIKEEYGIETEVVSMMRLSNPTKLTYNVGEVIDLTGLLVLIEYDDGTTEQVSGMLDGYVLSTETAQKSGDITITYEGFTIRFKITVNETTTPDAPVEPTEDGGLGVGAIVAIVLGGIVVVGAAAVGTIFAIRRKKTKKGDKSE